METRPNWPDNRPYKENDNKCMTAQRSSYDQEGALIKISRHKAETDLCSIKFVAEETGD